MIRGIFLLLVAWTMNVEATQDVFFGTVSSVSDGDTLWVRPEAGGRPRKLRLDGIDAPEICQTGGEASRMALANRTLNRRVEVTVRRYDDYGRGLARLALNNRDVGAYVVSAGHAWSYRWRQSLGPYWIEESEARRARRGIFSMAGPELPRDFRKRHGPCPFPVAPNRHEK